MVYAANGTCDPAFAGVRAALEQNLADGSDVGAAVAVYVDGRCVVDLWGGLADQRSGRAWERDTRCVTFSCTKAVTATAALLLAERGAVSLDAPVTDWWPEYGVHGKDGTTGEHLLTHQEGLPAFARPVSADEAADPAAMAAQLAGQSPEWEPGTAHGYHAITFGWLAGEIVRRRGGRTVGEFVRAEISPDLAVGVPPEELPTLARIAAPDRGRATGEPTERGESADGDPARSQRMRAELLAAYRDPESTLMRSTSNPSTSYNKSVVLTGGWPAAGLIATARALGNFYARLVGGEIVATQTLRNALRERVRGPDRTLVLDSAFGLGFMLPSSSMLLPPPARSTAFGHPGASGALGIGDLERRLAIGYVPNLIRPAVGDRRAYRIVDAVYSALGS
jgi:CubicO group peptidase (beta-lactamase class C family)